MIHRYQHLLPPWLLLLLLFWTTFVSSSSAWGDISVVPKSTTTGTYHDSDINQMISSEGGGLRIVRSRQRDLSSSSASAAADIVEVSQECKHESHIIQQFYDDIVTEYTRLNDAITQTPFQNFCIQTEDALSCTIPYKQFVSESSTSTSTIKDICLSKNTVVDENSSSSSSMTTEPAISTIYVESNIQLDCNENGSTTRLKSVNIPSCISSKCNLYDIETYVNHQLDIMKDTLSTSQALQCTGYYTIKLEGGTSRIKSSSAFGGSNSAVLILTTISITTILSLLSFTNKLF